MATTFMSMADYYAKQKQLQKVLSNGNANAYNIGDNILYLKDYKAFKQKLIFSDGHISHLPLLKERPDKYSLGCVLSVDKATDKLTITDIILDDNISIPIHSILVSKFKLTEYDTFTCGKSVSFFDESENNWKIGTIESMIGQNATIQYESDQWTMVPIHYIKPITHCKQYNEPQIEYKHNETELENQWECCVCTMLNHSALHYCELCQTQNSLTNLTNDFIFAQQLQSAEDEKSNMVLVDRELALQIQFEFDTAIKIHKKQNDLKSLTALMASILKQNVSETKQQGLHNMFKGDAIRNVHILLEKILNSEKLLEYVQETDVQQTIDLIHKYWNTFAESMNIIKTKQKQINILIDFCRQWTSILQKRQQLKDNETLNDKDVSFMNNISKIFSVWFKGEDDIEQISKRWVSLHQCLKEQHIFWQRKTAEIEEKIRQQIRKKQEMKTTWSWKKLFGSVAKWLGIAVTAVGAIVGIVFSGPIGLGVMGIGVGVTYFGNKYEKLYQRNIDDFKDDMIGFDETSANVQFIEETFDIMKKDASMMEKFFDDFIIQLRSPKNELSEIVEMEEDEECIFEVIEDNVTSMTESFSTLRETFTEAMKQIKNTIKQEQHGYVTLR
eukprot:242200_1